MSEPTHLSCMLLCLQKFLYQKDPEEKLVEELFSYVQEGFFNETQIAVLFYSWKDLQAKHLLQMEKLLKEPKAQLEGQLEPEVAPQMEVGHPVIFAFDHDIRWFFAALQLQIPISFVCISNLMLSVQPMEWMASTKIKSLCSLLPLHELHGLYQKTHVCKRSVPMFCVLDLLAPILAQHFTQIFLVLPKRHESLFPLDSIRNLWQKTLLKTPFSYLPSAEHLQKNEKLNFSLVESVQLWEKKDPKLLQQIEPFTQSLVKNLGAAC